MTTSTQTQLRRGTASQVNGMTPALGEPVVNTTNTRIHVGDGSTAGGMPHVTAADLQNQIFQYSTVGGTGDAITLTNSPAVTALAAGQKVRFKAGADNTTNVTIATDGLTAKAAKYMVNGALAQIPAAGIKAGAIIEADYDGTQYQITSGLNPTLASSSAFGLVKVDGSTITASGGVISAAGGIMTALGVGSIIIASSGSSVSAGSTTAGSNIFIYDIPITGGSAKLDTTINGQTGNPSGTWQSLQGAVASTISLWQRTV